MARIKLIIIIIVQVACLVIFVNFDFSEIVNRSCPSKKQRCSVHLANQMARDYSRKPENVTTTDAVDENNHSLFLAKKKEGGRRGGGIGNEYMVECRSF